MPPTLINQYIKVLIFSKWPQTGRLMPSLSSLTTCALLGYVLDMQIKCFGPLPRKRSSMSDLSIRSLYFRIVVHSLEGIFGILGHLWQNFYIYHSCLDSVLGESLHYGQSKESHGIVLNWCYICKKSRQYVDRALLHFCKLERVIWLPTNCRVWKIISISLVCVFEEKGLNRDFKKLHVDVGEAKNLAFWYFLRLLASIDCHGLSLYDFLVSFSISS